MHSIFKLFIFLALFGTSCTVPPPCSLSQMDIPAEWHSTTSEGMHSQSTDCFRWWKALNDPILDSLMERAAFQNLDLAIAGTRILEARNARRLNNCDKLSDCAAPCIVQACNDRSNQQKNLFEMGFDADWEMGILAPDFKIGLPLNAKAEAAHENFEKVWVTLSAEIARNYVELRAFQQRLNVVRSTIEAQKESLQLTQDLLKMGMSSSVDAAQAEGQYSMLAAEQPLIELAIKKTIHRLSILLGQGPGELYAELSSPQDLPKVPKDFPIGIPTDLLKRRPDIRLAEINLMQQSGNVNNIKTKQALFEYQKAVLEALEEAENAITSFHVQLERRHYLLQSQESAQSAYDLTFDLFKNGFRGYMDALLAQRTLFTARNAYIQSRLDLLTQYIALYKALGGAWYGCCADI
ncbi:MAG: TolC family protein [Candidatus Protochlamydia sp.]|nr:TolC family protein [Candidatus Protochlamydia sp.]